MNPQPAQFSLMVNLVVILKTLPPNGFFAFNFDKGLQVITGFTYYEGYTFLYPFVFSP